MRTTCIGLLSAGALAIGAGAAHADPPTEPGIPDTPNCKGQTTAYLAQAGQEIGAPGIGNLARAAGLSVKDAHAIIREFCAGS